MVFVCNVSQVMNCQDINVLNKKKWIPDAMFMKMMKNVIFVKMDIRKQMDIVYYLDNR